jgi:hypothetical protein
VRKIFRILNADLTALGQSRRHSFGHVSGQPPIPDLSSDAGNDAKGHNRTPAVRQRDIDYLVRDGEDGRNSGGSCCELETLSLRFGARLPVAHLRWQGPNFTA